MKAGWMCLKTFLDKYWYFILICLILALSFAFRMEVYLLDRQFWPDEAALAANIIQNGGQNEGFLWAFLSLDYFQMAPPLFLILTKFITAAFGLSEMVFRFLPFIFSIFSIPFFYLLSKKFLNTKRAIIFANFLYCINFALIRYSSEFKQYSGDVLIFMLVLLWLQRQNEGQSTETLNFRRGALISIVFTILFFISQPTIFLLFGFIACKFFCGLFQNIKNLKHYLICLIGVLPLVFIFLYRMQMPDDVAAYMQYYWKNGFISFGTARSLLEENLNFLFYGIKCLKFLSPLIFAGFLIFFYKTFKTGAVINKIFIFSLFGVFLASILHIYPFLNRMILFLFPFFFIFISSVFDFRMQNTHLNKLLTVFIIIFVFLFSSLFGAKIICKNRNDIIINCCKGRDLAIVLKENFKKDDVLMVSKFNEAYYKYYASLLGAKPCKVVILNLPEDRKIVEYLAKEKPGAENRAADGKNYWIFIPCDFDETSLSKTVQNLEKSGVINILYSLRTAQNSYLYKVKL